ncbi:MAG TPA: calcium sensor EFh [Cyanothece sp. UBA12306]|nr:calcium sensor EFh [Cyanothece sp. UBA12306]
MKQFLNDQQIEDLKKFFKEVDQDGNGQISKIELKQLLEEIWGTRENLDLDLDAAVESVFQKFDLNHDGFISFDEFISSGIK